MLKKRVIGQSNTHQRLIINDESCRFCVGASHFRRHKIAGALPEMRLQPGENLFSVHYPFLSFSAFIC